MNFIFYFWTLVLTYSSKYDNPICFLISSIHICGLENYNFLLCRHITYPNWNPAFPVHLWETWRYFSEQGQ
jgi:hypothetical protein